MGCQIKRPSNVYNFVVGHRVSDLDISDLSGNIVFCSDIVTPPQLFGSADNSTEFTLNWIPQGGETGFKIYRSADDTSYSLIDTLGGVTTYTDTDLTPETLYYYKVKAVGISGDSAFSNTVSDTTDELEAPSLLNLTNIDLEEITTNWTSNSGSRGDSFKVERSLTGVGGYAEIASVASGFVTYVDDTPPLDHGTTYYYRVRAEKDAVYSDYSNVASGTTATMAAPSNLQLTPTLDSVTATWTSNSGGEEDGFDLEASVDGVGGWVVVDSVGSGVNTGEETGLLQSTNRYYRVRATEAQGNSAYSPVVMTTTLTLQAPSGLVASLPNAPSQIQIDFTSNSGGEEDGFEIERSLDGVSGWNLIATLAKGITTFINENDVLPNTEYFYRARAIRSSGNSVYSNVDSAEIVWVAAMFGTYQFGQIDFGQGQITLEEFELEDNVGDIISDENDDPVVLVTEP